MRELISARNTQHEHNDKDLILTWHACKYKVHKLHQRYTVVFTHMPGNSYRKRLGSWLCLCCVFPALINSLGCWFNRTTQKMCKPFFPSHRPIVKWYKSLFILFLLLVLECLEVLQNASSRMPCTWNRWEHLEEKKKVFDFSKHWTSQKQITGLYLHLIGFGHLAVV